LKSGLSSLDKNAICHVCSSRTLYICDLSQALRRVTSDCRPWKSGGSVGVCENCGIIQHVVDKTWRKEISQIYQEYDIYHQGCGVENAIFPFGGEVPMPRSKKFLKRFYDEISLPKQGNILDVGCGNATFLSEFKLKYPQWALFGQDPNSKNSQAANFTKDDIDFYHCPIEKIDETFDLITLFHVLEHIEGPIEFLTKLKSKLKKDGKIVIQTPNLEQNPFDLVVADHCSHFTMDNFNKLTDPAGLEIQIVSNQWLFKEITLIATIGDNKTFSHSQSVQNQLSRLNYEFNWLEETIKAARKISILPNFGIFGTSTAAIWLDSELQKKAQYFVDEDPSRINQVIFGRPVLHTKNVPENGQVFMAMVPNQANKITERLALNNTTYHLPPLLRF